MQEHVNAVLEGSGPSKTAVSTTATLSRKWQLIETINALFFV